MNETEKKIEQSIRLIKSACKRHPYKIAFSGGKDSVVLNYLTKCAGYDVEKIYNATTIDPPGTIEFCKENNCTIQMPAKTFLQLVEKKGLPTMFRRFCCKELKEKYIADYVMTGVRKAESVKRNQRYCSFESVYQYSKKQSTLQLHPILFFDDKDIDYIIRTRELKCHDIYYDDNGTFHVERRLGCIGCPLQGDRGIADFIQYPKLLRSIAVRNLRFHANHGRSPKDAYLNMVYNLFYSNHGFKRYQQTYFGLFASDPKQFLEEYFKIDLP